MEDEFPIDRHATPAQEIWARKWRILKSAMLVVGRLPFNEIAPEILANLCKLVGFEDVHWTAHTTSYQNADVLFFFQSRLDALLEQLPNERLRSGVIEMASSLHAQASQAGGIEVPYYRVTAQK